jgi:hypothetical protein
LAFLQQRAAPTSLAPSTRSRVAALHELAVAAPIPTRKYQVPECTLLANCFSANRKNMRAIEKGTKAMKTKLFILAGLISVMSSATPAQTFHVFTSPTASFDHDYSYAWSQEPVATPLRDSFLADEVRTQINLHLTNVGLWPNGAPDSNVIVVLSSMDSDQSQATEMRSAGSGSSSSGQNGNNFKIELYQGGTMKLLWRAEAANILIEGHSKTDKKIVDWTVAHLFQNFPYYRNGWLSAERR